MNYEFSIVGIVEYGLLEYGGNMTGIRRSLLLLRKPLWKDHLCGLVVRVLGYRSGGPGSIPSTTRKKNVVGLERGALSLVSTN
jgi:hypothetical protein